MSLLEDWEQGSGTVAFTPDLASPEPAEAELGSPRHGANRAQFSLDSVERQINRQAGCCSAQSEAHLHSSAAAACRGRGSVLALAAAADSVALLTSRAYFIRYDLSQSTTPGALQLLRRCSLTR